MTIDRERKPEETRKTIERLNLRSNEKDKKALRSNKGVKEHSNAFWEIINPHRYVTIETSKI